MLSLVLLASLTVAQAADEPKSSQPAQGMPTMDCPMMKGGDGKMMMNCPMMKGGDGMTDGMPSMMSHHQMMMHDMMQMMKDMMTIQKQMLASPTAEAKMKMEADLSAMIEKMDKMMSSSHHMMMNMQKPATGGQQKEAPMPMEHKH